MADVKIDMNKADPLVGVAEVRKQFQAKKVRKRSHRGRISKLAHEPFTVAEIEAKKMRTVNPAQYYRQNLGQLGFGDPEHALVQTIKELTDNSLDATEAMGVLPEITVKLTATAKQYEVVTNKTREGSIRRFPIFRVSVEDNGCGVVRGKVAKAFGKVLYGSKFFSFKQSRGQQGLGVHAAIIYAQLTSLEPAIIITKTETDLVGYKVELKIDTEKNAPVVISSGEAPFDRVHGTRVDLMVAGDYTDRVESFIKELSLANPHADLKFKVKATTGEEQKVLHFKRATDMLPPQPKEIKPHLLSMEPGALLEMKSNDICCKTARQFLVKHFVRISAGKALYLLKKAKIASQASPKEIDVELLLKAAREGDIMRPPLDVLSPIGEEALRHSLKRIYPDAEFIASTSREPWSYRGVPFQVEVGAAYSGSSVSNECATSKETVFKSKIVRLGNKCPLIYDSKDCLLYKVVKEINWRNYKISQEEGNPPAAPLVIVVSLISTKVPYIVPGKFAVAYHEEIREQLRLALQTLGRMIYGYISHRQRQEHEQHRQSIFAIYAKEVAKDLSVLAEKDAKLLLNGLLESVKHKKPKKAASHELKPQTKVEITATKNIGVKADSKAEAKVETKPVVMTKPVEMPPQKKVEKGQHTLDIFFG